VTTVAAARAYRERILAALPGGSRFTPLMTCYLTDATTPDELADGIEAGVWVAAKLYPAHATTNSAHGVRDVRALRACFERMERLGMPLLVHGEVTDPDIDIFDREAVFLDRVLGPLRREHPGLPVVLEHVTTAAGVAFVEEGEGRIGGTITVQHLMHNRNAMLVGGLRPHLYCLPVLKTETDRLALRRAATSGLERFFLGTDSAPHLRSLKECACGCAGCFTSINTMSCLAHVFEEEGALDKLESFASLNGPAWYRLAPNEEQMTLVKRDAPVEHPSRIETGAGPVTVFDPLFKSHWAVETKI
jgi:dihydroorotase